MGESNGSTTVIPGDGRGEDSGGVKARFTKYVPGIVKPRGVGTESGLEKTSMETVVVALAIPGGNVTVAREPNVLSVTVPPVDGLTLPSDASEGFRTTMLLGMPMALSWGAA